MRFNFAGKRGRAPEEAFFRYYLSFANAWSPDVDGGKRRGFSRTYGRVGGGFRRSTCSDSRVMRGQFSTMASRTDSLLGPPSLGTDAYHADIDEASTETWAWPLGRLAALERILWDSIEPHISLNTPGRKEGIQRAWIDGRLTSEKTDIRMRTVPELRIESVWFNVYQGGTQPAAQCMQLYIARMVIARKYIRPMTPMSGGLQ